MTNIEQFNWLARNVSEWPVNTSYCGVSGGVLKICSIGDKLKKREGYAWFNQADVEKRRKELINKPSWRDAPEWAMWLCQNDYGAWFWCESEQERCEEGWKCVNSLLRVNGSIIGDPLDWTNSLEKRPQSEAKVF